MGASVFATLKLAIPSLLAAALVAASPMLATAQLKIGVVDVPRLSAEAPQAEAAGQLLENEFAGRKRALVAEQEALTQLQERLQRDSGTSANPAYTAKLQGDLRTRQRDFQRNVQKYEEDLNRRRSVEIDRLHRLIAAEIQSFGREEGFDLVLTDVGYHSAQIDVTDRVLERLKSAAGGQP